METATINDRHLPLVEIYQAGRQASAAVAAKPDRQPTPAQRLKISAGSDAAVQLVNELVGLVLDRVRREALQRREHGWFERHLDDLRADSIEWLLNELQRFKPGEGSVAAYVATRASWQAADLLYTYSQDAGRLERSWYQIRSASASCVDRLRETLGRTPSRSEISRELLDDARRSLSARLTEKDPTLASRPDELARKVHDRLSRDGFIAAVGNLDAIMNLGPADIRFDAFKSIDGEDHSTVGETTPGDLDVHDAIERDRAGHLLEDLYAVALGDAQWARGALSGRLGLLGVVEGDESLDGVRRGGDDADRRLMTVPRLAELTGQDRVVLRHTLDAVQPRLAAPHAQFAHLAALPIREVVNPTVGTYDRADFVDA